MATSFCGICYHLSTWKLFWEFQVLIVVTRNDTFTNINYPLCISMTRKYSIISTSIIRINRVCCTSQIFRSTKIHSSWPTCCHWTWKRWTPLGEKRQSRSKRSHLNIFQINYFPKSHNSSTMSFYAVVAFPPFSKPPHFPEQVSDNLALPLPLPARPHKHGVSNNKLNSNSYRILHFLWFEFLCKISEEVHQIKWLDSIVPLLCTRGILIDDF